MKNLPVILMIIFLIFGFSLHILALMKVFPLIISIPLFFIGIFMFLFYLNDRKRFKGF
ncbi:multisubunit Na+/H+ antiporter MnhC subunit [Neobacillus niacini]|nr:multisubunit Na+/H+ antiporter MnhC subunit [Neobacillus niacini]